MTLDEVRRMSVPDQLAKLGQALEMTGFKRLNAGNWLRERSGTRATTGYGCGEALFRLEDDRMVYVHHRSDHLLYWLLTGGVSPVLMVFCSNLRKVLDMDSGTP